MYHTVVIGGGCLGAATAISLQRKLNESGKGGKVCLLDKAVLCAANLQDIQVLLDQLTRIQMPQLYASLSSNMWKNLEKQWGKNMEIDSFGAIWIAKKNSDGENPAWDELSQRMKKIDLVFEEISSNLLLINAAIRL